MMRYMQSVLLRASLLSRVHSNRLLVVVSCVVRCRAPAAATECPKQTCLREHCIAAVHPPQSPSQHPSPFAGNPHLICFHQLVIDPEVEACTSQLGPDHIQLAATHTHKVATDLGRHVHHGGCMRL